jgi:hypothetical protein
MARCSVSACHIRHEVVCGKQSIVPKERFCHKLFSFSKSQLRNKVEGVFGLVGFSAPTVFFLGPHFSLGYLTPAAFEQQGELPPKKPCCFFV